MPWGVPGWFLLFSSPLFQPQTSVRRDEKPKSSCRRSSHQLAIAAFPIRRVIAPSSSEPAVRHSVPNQFRTVCRLCHVDVAPGGGLAIWRGGGKGWRVLCAACVEDPDSASERGGYKGWVFALAWPGRTDLTIVGCSRFPALRCVQIIREKEDEARRRDIQLPLVCEAWAIEVSNRFAARTTLRAALAGWEGEENAFRVALSEALDVARKAGLTGEAVSVRPTAAEWNTSGL